MPLSPGNESFSEEEAAKNKSYFINDAILREIAETGRSQVLYDFDGSAESGGSSGGAAAPEITWPALLEAIVTKIQLNLDTKFNIPLSQPVRNPLRTDTLTLMQLQSQIISTLHQSFSKAPPFTVQRLAELMIQPEKYYSPDSPDKYLRALEKVVHVGSCYGDFVGCTGASDGNSADDERSNDSFEDHSIVMKPIPWLAESEGDQSVVMEDLEAGGSEEGERNEQAKRDESFCGAEGGMDTETETGRPEGSAEPQEGHKEEILSPSKLGKRGLESSGDPYNEKEHPTKRRNSFEIAKTS